MAAAFIMGWIGTGCPVRHRLNHWFVNRHRNRSESSVFYSCRFSFSGLMAAKLAAFKVIWRSAQPICFLDKSHIAFSFYIRRTIVFNLSNPQRPAQLYPSLPGVEGARALAREAQRADSRRPLKKEIAFIDTNL